MAAQARHVDKWVSEGIISRDQAESIYEYERQVTPSRITAVEVLGYVGASTAIGAIFILVSDIWDQQGWGSRLAILSVTAVAFLVIGLVSAGEEGPSVRRFGQVLLALAVPMIAFAAAAAASRWITTDPSVLVGFGIAWIAAVPLYLRWRSSAQQVALFFATVGVVMSLFVNLFAQGSEALPGTIAFAVGVVWLTMSGTGVVVPRLTGEVLGAVTALVGSVMLAAALTPNAGFVLAGFVALSGLAVVVGVRCTRTALVVIGLVGFVVYIPWFTTEIFDPSFAAPLTMVAIGLAFTVIALVRAKRN